MYVPAHFAESRPEVLHGLIRDYPLAALVGPSADGLDANLIPFVLDADVPPLGRLRGHVARANPLWRDPNPREVLALFHGPSAYVSPTWYPVKPVTGRVVPTWNYIVVQARCQLRVIEDPAWIRQQIDDLTRQQESLMPNPWTVADAPPEFIDGLVAGIVGLELTVTHLTGKWKLSQNQPAANRQGVMDGLRGMSDAASRAVADEMAPPA